MFDCLKFWNCTSTRKYKTRCNIKPQPPPQWVAWGEQENTEDET